MLFVRKGALQRLFLRLWIGPYVIKSQGWRYNECPWKGGQIFRSCKICTSAIHGGRIPQRASKAIWLCLCYFTSLPALAAPVCPTVDYDETTSIRYIVDGDTLHLKDGRKVRLIGINAPEVTHGNRTAEPFAAEASAMLKQIFRSRPSISLVYGKEKHDRYDRLLAHVFTADGKNVQAILLRQGYTRAIAFPPNTRFTSCYLQQERFARCDKKGLWKKTQPLPAKKLKNSDIGFQLVSGRLKSIKTNKKGIWLNLDDRLTVGVRPDNQSLFDIGALHKMLNQNIVIRGWLNKNKKYSSYYIRVRHPSSIQLAETFACD